MSLEDKQAIAVVAPTVESTGDRIRVLVVDDSPFSRKLLEHALRGQPYELAFAKDGKEALASIVPLISGVGITADGDRYLPRILCWLSGTLLIRS